MALVPIASTIAYMAREPHFTWAGCIPYILPNLIPLLMYIPSWKTMRHALCSCSCRRSAPLNYTARIRLNAWPNEPDSFVRQFSTVLWNWHKHSKTVNCKTLSEECVSRRYWDDNDDEQVMSFQPIFVDDSTQLFWHTDRPNIQYSMWIERNSDREGNNLSEIAVKVSFTGSGLTPNIVVEHIDAIAKEAKKLERERKRKQRVLVTTSGSDSRSGNYGPEFMTYKFATTSSFTNFFCEEADLIQRDLVHFLENKASYTKTGRPWTYTVLNEGPPGVGKTKLVKAIAAQTKRTLIIINLEHIPDVQTLYDIFHASVLGGEHLPHDQRLYYIPEIDTQMFDVLKDRKSTPVVAKTRQAIVKHAIDDEPQVINHDSMNVPAKTESKRPTLGMILNVLDGVPERHGHIIVMDTNHLAELDPALVRPGRVDRIVSWGPMNDISIRKYAENYYSACVPSNIVLPNKVHTAAELQAIAMKHTTLDAFLDTICVNSSSVVTDTAPLITKRVTRARKN